jgi:hypothetical protein
LALLSLSLSGCALLREFIPKPKEPTPVPIEPTPTYTPSPTAEPIEVTPTATEPTKQITATPVNEAYQKVDEIGLNPNFPGIPYLWEDGVLTEREEALVYAISQYDPEIQPLFLQHLDLSDGVSDQELFVSSYLQNFDVDRQRAIIDSALIEESLELDELLPAFLESYLGKASPEELTEVADFLQYVKEKDVEAAEQLLDPSLLLVDGRVNDARIEIARYAVENSYPLDRVFDSRYRDELADVWKEEKEMTRTVERTKSLVDRLASYSDDDVREKLVNIILGNYSSPSNLEISEQEAFDLVTLGKYSKEEQISMIDSGSIVAGNPQIKIRGVWLSSLDEWLKDGLDQHEIDELKEAGINYVQVVVWPQVLDNESVYVLPRSFGNPDDRISYNNLLKESSKTEEKVISRINALDEAGFGTYLVIYPERYGAHELYGKGLRDVEEFLSKMEEITLEYARVAEENDVEMFSPPNELQLWVGAERAMKWYEDILPKIKEIYSGEVAPRGLTFYDWDSLNDVPIEKAVAKFNFAGWDYIASDVYCNQIESLEEFKTCLRATIYKSIELKEKYGAKGIIYGEISHLGGSNPELENSKEYNIKSYDIFSRENLGRADGIFFWNWESYCEEMKKIIKQYYRYKQSLPTGSIEMPETVKLRPDKDYRIKTCGILFKDDFSSRNMPWTNPEFIRDGRFEFYASRPMDHSISFLKIGEDWTDYKLSGRFLVESGAAWIGFRRLGERGYSLGICPAAQVFINKGKIHLEVDPYLVELGKWHDFELWADKKRVSLYIDGNLVLSFEDPDAYRNGGIGLGTVIPNLIKDGHVFFDDIIVEKICY